MIWERVKGAVVDSVRKVCGSGSLEERKQIVIFGTIRLKLEAREGIIKEKKIKVTRSIYL